VAIPDDHLCGDQSITLTGRDTAAGKSYAAWLKRKEAGRAAAGYAGATLPPPRVAAARVVTAIDIEARGRPATSASPRSEGPTFGTAVPASTWLCRPAAPPRASRRSRRQRLARRFGRHMRRSRPHLEDRRPGHGTDIRALRHALWQPPGLVQGGAAHGRPGRRDCRGEARLRQATGGRRRRSRDHRGVGPDGPAIVSAAWSDTASASRRPRRRGGS
jgi:hypothetical protein